jgi:hypothetical protein
MPLPSSDADEQHRSLAELLLRRDESAARVFVGRWFRPSYRGVRWGDTELASSFPVALARFYAATEGRFEQVQNRLLAPSDVGIVDGRLLFYVENQRVVEWATDRLGGDPPVWFRVKSASYGDWRLESEPLSRFLLQVALHEAIFTAPFIVAETDLDPQTVSQLTRSMSPIPLGPLGFPEGMRFWVGDESIGFVYPTAPDDPGDARASVSIGALKASALDRAAEILGQSV